VNRKVALGMLVAALVLGIAPAARAHPLGNFTVNRYAEVVVGPETVTVRYVLDPRRSPRSRSCNASTRTATDLRKTTCGDGRSARRGRSPRT
jgi:hypothetical protein